MIVFTYLAMMKNFHNDDDKVIQYHYGAFRTEHGVLPYQSGLIKLFLRIYRILVSLQYINVLFFTEYRRPAH